MDAGYFRVSLPEMVIIWLSIWYSMAPLEPHPSVLVSYDVPQGMRTMATRVSHVIFGRGDEGEDAPLPYIRRPGVVWLGQSVFLLPPSTARELANRLESMGAKVAMAQIGISRAELDAFRHRMHRHLPP